jgi:hypothetical protein
MSLKLRIAVSLSLLVVVVLQGQACGKVAPMESAELPSNGVSQNLPPVVALPEKDLQALETVRVVHRNEFLSSVTSVLDLPYSTTLYTAFNSMAPNLSDNGYVDSVTAPLMNAVLSIHGSACSEQLRRERAMASAERQVFKGFDFAKSPTAQPPTATSDLIRTLARRAWLRNETQAERDAIQEAAKLFDTAVAADTEKKALFICSAMLSSLDAITR